MDGTVREKRFGLQSVIQSLICAFAFIGTFSLMTLLTTGSIDADSNIPRESSPKSWQADADLTDVFFLNSKLGWAVGGQGVVLRTRDGGKHWLEISQASRAMAKEISLKEKFMNMQRGAQTQWTGVTGGATGKDKPFRCRFESVHFVDEQNGWIAGGYDVPYVDRSRAVVLRTRDGGASWQTIEGLVIPRIERIHFSDQSNGWALGAMGNLFRTGIYYTSDGGQTWSSQSSGMNEDWIDGDQIGNGFVNLDSSGRLGRIKNNQYEASVMLGDVKSKLHCVRMVDEKNGWAVGDSGAILQTTNGGLSWAAAISEDESSLFRHFDFTSISITPGKIWIAGNPGSVVFSIDTNSGSILAFQTGSSFPISDVHFVDDNNGWAVGSLGTILATTDGGQNWQKQRGKQQGLSFLAMAETESGLPLALFANFAGEESLIGGAAVIGREMSSQGIQAAERLGCSTIIDLKAAEGSRRDHLRELVRTIRTMRPRVIVNSATYQPKRGKGNQLSPNSLLAEAITAAADRNAYPEQIIRIGLQPWQVDRLVMPDQSGSLSIDAKRMLPRMGSLVEDRIAVSRALLRLPLVNEQPVSFRIQNLTAIGAAKPNDPFAGLAKPGQPLPRRDAAGELRGNLQAIQLATSKEKKFDQFVSASLQQTNVSTQSMGNWQQQVLSWTLTLDENVAGIWLAQLAERFLDVGQTEMAAQTLELLATRLDRHPLSPAAYTWLAQFYASDEMGMIEFKRRLEFASQNNASQIAVAKHGGKQATPKQVTVNGVTHTIWSEDQPVDDQVGAEADAKLKAEALAELEMEGEVKLASLEDEAPVSVENRNEAAPLKLSEKEINAFFEARWRLASQYLSRLAQRDPDLVSGPQYRIIEAQIARKLNGSKPIEGLLKLLSKVDDGADDGVNGGEGVGVSIGAQRELILGGMATNVVEPLDVVTCIRATERPRLDGKLNDPLWQAVEQGGWERSFQVDAGQDLAMFGFDDQFLYAAFRCRKMPGQSYKTGYDARPRDADLTRRDRVEFSIDLDRDYRTANHFTVDYRGWVGDQCGGAKGWDPKWFVSRIDDDQYWSVELAIPLDQIIPGQLPEDSIWAVKMTRRTYDSTNLWGQQEVKIAEDSKGLRSGFYSQPVQYELMKFK